jgi:serine/threonine-protein kinase
VPDIPERLSAALAGRYRLERELGQGGMATVYLAEDLKHQRKVAVKVLRPELAATLGPERFAREIAVAARLQHPHILGVLDSGEANDPGAGDPSGRPSFFYYVMPYVEGETLRDRLARSGELPVHEAVRLLGEIADALAVAHRAGVVHRDIKPENILLSGRHAMVMDFGVAKAVSEASGRQQLTTAGVALGTPAYMAPEQASADPQMDGRVDIYALGVLGYEMLTGHTPFHGLNPQQTLAAHVTQAPAAVGQQRAGLSPALEAVVMRCLAKRPADRYQTADELVVALEPLATPSGGMTPTHTQPIPAVSLPAGWRQRALVIGVAVLMGLAALGFLAWRLTSGGSPPLEIGRSDQLTSEAGLEIQPAVSPDGKLVAYAAGNSSRMRIYLRPVGGGRTIPMSDDSTAVETQPRWSPDGVSLLFLTRGGVAVAPALGGSSRPVVAPTPRSAVTTAAWSPDGREMVFVRDDSLQVIPLSGGSARLLATGGGLHSCSWSPAGRWIACVSQNGESIRPGASFGNLAPSAIVLVPAAGGAPVRLVEAQAFNQSPVWSPDGRLLYFLSNRDGPRDIYALTLSSSGRPRGEATRLTTGLGALSISLAADGRRLAYAIYSARANIWALPIPSGAPVSADAATPVTSGNQVIESMRVSHDGRWLVFDSDLRGNADIYRVPVSGGQPEQLTSDPADEFAPDLSPDGRAIAYHSWRTGTRDIEIKPLDGGPVVRVTDTPAQESYPVWSPDGRTIMFYDQVTPFTIYLVRQGPDGHWSAPPTRLVSPGVSADWSRDGAWIAYVGSISDAQAGPVMVISAAGGVPRRLFDPGPAAPEANLCMWSPDGRTLYYKAHDAQGHASFWSVSPAGGAPRLLVRFTDPDRQSTRKDFATDGKRLYFTIEDRQSDVFVAEIRSR